MSAPTKPSPFHRGEEAVQSQAGVREFAEHLGPRIIRDAMPEQHRELFSELLYVVVGGVDAEGNRFASMLVGAPGFVSSPDATTLVIEASPVPGDPIATTLRVGSPIGVLGIELATRRRNRANGVLVAAEDGRLVIEVRESFGNCPQYIQARTPLAAVRRTPSTPRPEGSSLTAEAIAVVRAADTLFIASGASNAERGATIDDSHRGGKPGFVRVGPDGVLTMPDFSGNNLFMTLGNLREDPAAGMVIVDFASGALLSLTGTAEVVWEGPELTAFAGAERLVRFRPRRGALLPGALPLVWSEVGYAKQLARTGAW